MKTGSSFGTNPAELPAPEFTNLSDNESVNNSEWLLKDALSRLQPGVPATGNNWMVRAVYFVVKPMMTFIYSENPPNKYKVVWNWDFGMALLLTLYCIAISILYIVSLV
jgi:hypothetical protein